MATASDMPWGSKDRPSLPLDAGPIPSITMAYGNLPLYFTKNAGEAPPQVRYLERGRGHATFFTDKGVVLALARANSALKATPRIKPLPKTASAKKTAIETLGLSFLGAEKSAAPTAEQPLPGRVNYFVGRDKAAWKTDILTYGALEYRNIYKNIDVRFYGSGGNLEHDIIVHPGGKPSVVRFGLYGACSISTESNGDLVISLEKGRLIQKKPRIYQVIGGRKVAIDGRYKVFARKDGTPAYGFEVASYDRTKDLVIDPVLMYSTYLGGISIDAGLGIAVDSTGAAYIAGYTISPDFPTVNPIQGFGGSAYTDAFVAKLSPAGDALVYSTYLGGSLSDYASDIAVDPTGAVYVSGSTLSTDYPLVSPIQSVHGGVVDVTITKLNPAGDAIVYSSFLGGSDEDWALGIDIDSTGAAYMTGYALSVDYPVINAVQPAFGGGLLDSFVTKISPSGTALVYSTYLGGSSGEHGNDIAVDQTGAVYVTGQTWSVDFPLVSQIQGTLAGGNDVYVTKIDATGSAIAYSTLLGGTGDDAGNAIVVDTAGAAYVAGETNSADFPTLNAAQGAYMGAGDGFVTKISPTGAAMEYSTYLGGSGIERAFGIGLDSTGSAFVTGQTLSADFPIVDPVQSVFGGSDDGFVTKLSTSGSLFLYSTFLGGADSDGGFALTTDTSGNTYVTGFSYSTDFPLVAALQGTNGGTADAFVAKISAAQVPVVSLLIRPDAASVAPGAGLGYTLMATNTTTTAQCFQYWEDVTLPDGTAYPPKGALRGPVNTCLDPGATLSRHLRHQVPASAVPGPYVLNAYLGTYPAVQESSDFNFTIGSVVLPVSRRGADSAGPLQ